jgi:hypothetical protein
MRDCENKPTNDLRTAVVGLLLTLSKASTASLVSPRNIKQTPVATSILGKSIDDTIITGVKVLDKNTA